MKADRAPSPAAASGSAFPPGLRGGSLVFHQAALGDFVLTWPLLRRLPTPVRVVAPWGHATLAADSLAGVEPVGIEQFEFSRMHARGGPTVLSPAVRELFEATSCVVSFIAGAGSAWADNAGRLLGHADRVLLDPRPPAGFTGHVTEWHAQAVEPGLSLAPARAAEPASAAAPQAPVLLHPGSGGLMKCWPRVRFAELGRRLVAAGHNVRFVLGEAEAERWNHDALAELQVEGASMETFATLAALRAAIEGCRLYVGNDAGPTHLAAQVGKPTLALFGPSDATRFHPMGPAAAWLAPARPQAMHWLHPNPVSERALEMLDALG